WLPHYPLEPASAPALLQLLWHGRLWFLPLLAVLLVPLVLVFKQAADPAAKERAARVLVVTGAAGLVSIGAIGLAIDINGWTWKPLALVFGNLPGRQPGLGYGAALVAAAALVFLCHGLALTGWVKGDTFVAGAIGASIALVGVFTIYPLGRLFVNAFLDSSGKFSIASLSARLA